MVFYFLEATFVFISCEYEPRETPLTKLVKPSSVAPPITIELNPQTDTLWVYERVKVHYSFNAGPRKVHMVIFCIDGVEFDRQEYSPLETYEVNINGQSYGEGLHDFTIYVITSTNSGSLADILKTEGYLYEINWPLVIDRTPPGKMAILSADSVMKGVRLRWEPFVHAAFENYRIQKYSDLTGGGSILADIRDRRQDSFIDTTYIEGETATYSIYLNDYESNYTYYKETPSPPRIVQTGDFSVEMSWNPTRMPGNLAYYYVYLNNIEFPLAEYNKIFSPLMNSRSFEEVAFGMLYNFQLKYVPKSMTNTNNLASIRPLTSNFYSGSPMPSHDYSRDIPGQLKMILIAGKKLAIYDLVSGSNIDSLYANFVPGYPVIVSPEGELYGYSSDDEFFVRSTIDNSLVYHLSSPEYKGDQILMFSLTSNKLLVSYNTGIIRIYNLESGKMIIETSLLPGTIYAKFSPDGNHVMVKNLETNGIFAYFKIEGSVISEMVRMNETRNPFTSYFTFSPDNKLYLYFPGRLEVRNPDDFSLINEFSLVVGSFEAFDFDDQKLFICSNESEEGYLIDLTSGMVTNILWVENLYFTNFKNNILISGVGRKLVLSESAKNNSRKISEKNQKYYSDYNSKKLMK